MDVPGLSIFQNGGESIQVNNSANRLEEEEALEDQKRRNEELGNQLQTAFDDLIDDDDYTVDSSDIYRSHLSNNNGPAQNHHDNNNESLESRKNEYINNNHIGDQHQSNINSDKYLQEIEKLKKIIQSKDNELENITQIVHDERKKSDELTKRLALAEAEKSRTQMTKQQTHELLVESKAKCSEFENTIQQLKQKIKNLEDNNTELVGDLERTRNMLSDVQQKYHMVEKNAGYTADRHAEVLIKQANERHLAQIEMMQQQIDNLRNKLDNKEMELKTLDTRYKELQRNRETLLIDKAETINQLAKSLEDSQRQCQQLMAHQDYGQENIKLKRLVCALEKQADDMQKTINNLTERLDATTAELETMDSVLHENIYDDDIDHHITIPKHKNLTKLNCSTSTPITSTADRLNRLKNELYRCMSSMKLKRDEIRKLQDQLTMKNDEIKNLKDDENKSLVQITTFKEENNLLKNRIRILEQELEEMKIKPNNFDENIKLKLENEIVKLKELNINLRNDFEDIRKKYELIKDEKNQQNVAVQTDDNERKRIDSQIKNLNIDLEEFKQEHESLKINYQELIKENEQLKRRQSYDPLRLELEKHKFLLKDAQKECDRVKNLYIDISNTKETIAIELAQLQSSDMYKELHDEKQKSINLEKALELTALKNSELMNILEMEKELHQQELNKLREQKEKEKVDFLKSPKNSSDNNCAKCIENISEITKMEIKKIKLENQLTKSLRQIDDLQLKVNQSQELIAELNKKIALQEEQDILIADLKTKAQQFENYINKSHNNSQQSSPLNCDGKIGDRLNGGRATTSTSGVSSTSPQKQIESRDQSVATSPDLQDYNRRGIENKIRDEMAKIFAIELRNMEERFKLGLKDFELQNIQLKDDLQRINSDLKLRQNEVQLLKHAILSEREKMLENKKIKDLEAEQIIKQQNIILHKCRDELNIKENRIENLIRELDDRNIQIEAERQSMKAVMTQWEQQNSNKQKNESDWHKIIDDIKADHNKIIESLKLKYDSAKKTANNYKRYAEAKEKHMMEEYERLKAEYTLAKTRLQTRYHEFVDEKTKSMKEEITKIRLEYEEKSKNL